MTSLSCPCCGGEISPLDLLMHEPKGAVAFNGEAARFSPIEFKLVKALIEAYPNALTKPAAMDALYSDVLDPPHEKVIDVFICKVRKRLDRLGLVVTTNWAVGWSIELADPAQADALRAARLKESRNKRFALMSGDVAEIQLLRRQGYPITDIARRLNFTFRAVTEALDLAAMASSTRESA